MTDPTVDNDTATPGRTIAADIEGMLRLLESFVRPMSDRGKGAAPGQEICGLIGDIWSSDPSRNEEFRLKLAELMIEYDVDKIDCAWCVPQVVKRFARPSIPRYSAGPNDCNDPEPVV